MREYITILRGLLAGEKVTYTGTIYDVAALTIGHDFPPTPIFLAAVGPQMLRLAGAVADGACLNWATPEQIAASRALLDEGAQTAGRSAGDIALCMSVRIAVDDDVAAARGALASTLLHYALARPGKDPATGYRGHFARMGFDAALRDLEARRDASATFDELVEAAPDEMLLAFGYYGSGEGAVEAVKRLSVGLDELIVRVVPTRPGVDGVRRAMETVTPALLRAL
jgi:alkanesulfonate monooxygenase SsuD/methylene tetrahydromethanopterin reductase-like flavin-dependent oxidoreductase (luciferase family)